jgi:hypothetical protein
MNNILEHIWYTKNPQQKVQNAVHDSWDNIIKNLNQNLKK